MWADRLFRGPTIAPVYIPKLVTTLVFDVSQTPHYTIVRQSVIIRLQVVKNINIINMPIYLQSLQCRRGRVGQCLRQQRTSAIDIVLQHYTLPSFPNLGFHTYLLPASPTLQLSTGRQFAIEREHAMYNSLLDQISRIRHLSHPFPSLSILLISLRLDEIIS